MKDENTATPREFVQEEVERSNRGALVRVLIGTTGAAITMACAISPVREIVSPDFIHYGVPAVIGGSIVLLTEAFSAVRRGFRAGKVDYEAIKKGPR